MPNRKTKPVALPGEDTDPARWWIWRDCDARCPMPVADAERLPGGSAGPAIERGLREKLPETSTPETKEGGHTECLN